MSIDMKVKMGPKCFSGIKDLDEGRSIDENQILELCRYIDERLDCADFRMVSLLRTMYSYNDLLSEETLQAVKETILNFKYWMDEPGEDSMCYWSENHQILFAACEYLAGQLYPGLVFGNSGMTGREHMEKARKRILLWLKHRFLYGFIEWHSNTYYEEDIAPLTILIDFCNDREIVTKSQIIMDLLLLDMAMHSYRGLFSATSGRCYEDRKKHPLMQDTLEIAEKVWGFGNIREYDYTRISANFLLMKNYEVPPVIRLIGLDDSTAEIKDSMGLNLKEIKSEFEDMSDIETTGMFLWAMESFTNPESINMTLKIFNRWKLYNNNFLKDLRIINIKPLVKTGLLPLVVKLLNPVTQGIAIQRANSYTYKTKSYMLSTVQSHHPGEFGDQQHIWQATLSSDVTVFTTHPGCSCFDDSDRNFSPSYWVGNGIMPHSVQHKNVHMSIYNLNRRRGFMERKRLMFTHAYFPQDKFDEVRIHGNYLFGRLRDVYVALIGKNRLRMNDGDSSDIIQDGSVTWWICELGTEDEYGSFDAFCDDISSRRIVFKRGTLEYYGKSKLSLAYGKGFKVDDIPVRTNYDRYETPYVSAPRKPQEMKIQFAGRYLYLNFDAMIREYG